MTEVFSSLSGLVRRDRIVTDNVVFQLHSKFTVGLLVALCLLVTAIQYFGSPIDCLGDYTAVPQNIFNLYCWSATTYSLPTHWKGDLGFDLAYPGVGTSSDSKNRVYHSYYQWVWFVLCVQALFFYTPHFIWKSVENDRISHLLLDLDQHILTDKKRRERCQTLVKYLVTTAGTHGSLFWTFSFLEVINLINVIVQIFVMNTLIGGNFLSIGTSFIYSKTSGPNDDPVTSNPLIRVFPRMTKCSFRKMGSSGDVEQHDALCLLSVNHVHEKVFIILWFWFLFLAISSILAIICRAMVLFSKDCRIIVLQTRGRLVAHSVLEQIVSRTSVGDWFLLLLLAKNMDGFNLKTLAEDYFREIRRHCSLSDDLTQETSLMSDESKTCADVCNCHEFERKDCEV